MPAWQNLKNRRFNRLTAKRYVGSGKWLCRCRCGAETTVPTKALNSGNTGSCGCATVDATRARSRTHGQSRTSTYRSWVAMMRRCNNPDAAEYERYGGAGIRVCRRWHKFENFLADMGHRPPQTTIERRRNHLGYYPSNCRWASLQDQQRNRRNTIFVTYKGQTKPLAAWCDELGLRYGLIVKRFRRTGDFAKAIAGGNRIRVS